jgi:hypothetical protein
VSDLDEVRAAICRAHELPDQVASLLQGESIDELETSAARLAELLAAREPEPEPEPEPADPLAAALANRGAAKRQRQRQLMAALHGQPTQPRDDQGRFVSGGFGGGARRPVPEPKSPEQAHDEVVLQLAQLSKLGRSQF